MRSTVRQSCSTQLVYEEARDDTNWYDFLAPQLRAFQTEAVSAVGRMWTGVVLANASDAAVLRGMQAAPQALSPVVGFSGFNLRPCYPYTAIPAVSIGLICESAPFFLPIESETEL